MLTYSKHSGVAVWRRGRWPHAGQLKVKSPPPRLKVQGPPPEVKEKTPLDVKEMRGAVVGGGRPGQSICHHILLAWYMLDVVTKFGDVGELPLLAWCPWLRHAV